MSLSRDSIDPLSSRSKPGPLSSNGGRHRSFSAASNTSSNSHVNNCLNMFGGVHRDTQHPLNAPLTPTGSTTQLFPSLYNRRFSKDTTCSSSSSLYEMNTAASGGVGAGTTAADDGFQRNNNNDDNFSHTSSFLKSYNISSDDDDDESDTDIDDLVSRNGITTPKLPSLSNKNRGLFKKNWDISRTNSPTVSKNGYNSGPSSPSGQAPMTQYFDENTPIFKRIVSRNSVKPQLKSFRRVSNELFQESLPFENEINHENLMLLNLKEEEDILNHHAMKRQVNEEKAAAKEKESLSHQSSKFDIIRKANESWNMKKTMATTNSRQPSSTPSNKQQGIIGPSILDKLSPAIIVRSQLQPLTPLTPIQNRPPSPTNSHTSTATNLSQTTQNSSNTLSKRLKQQTTTQHKQQPASVMLASLKHKRTDESDESQEQHKRRAVANSSISSGYLKRSTNVKLISKASNDLEKMSLD